MSTTLPRVVIDLNSTDEDGETIVFLSDVSSGELQQGRMVTAYEPEDGVAAPAFVSSIHPDEGVAFLLVNWRAMRREDPQSSTFRLERSGFLTNTASRTAVALTKSTRVVSGAISLKGSAAG